MQGNDQYILAAMDGRDLDAKELPAGKAPREEPAAFFFIIFGLVYEALVTSSADTSSSTTTRQPVVIAALRALKCLVRPEYAGLAIMEPTIFDEFISLCYRLAMTESANIQVHLVDMLANFASTQNPKSNGTRFV